jgi:hypothetical protein
MAEIDSSTINTMLLIVVIPVIGYLARALTKLASTMGMLKTEFVKVSTVLLGTEDQGGLVRRVEGISSRMHELATDMTVMKGEMGFLHMEVQGIKRRRESQDDPRRDEPRRETPRKEKP